MNNSVELIYQCLLCKSLLLDIMDDHFYEHMRYHNVTHNQDFILTTIFLDDQAIKDTIKFMMNAFIKEYNTTSGELFKIVASKETETPAFVKDGDKDKDGNLNLGNGNVDQKQNYPLLKSSTIGPLNWESMDKSLSEDFMMENYGEPSNNVNPSHNTHRDSLNTNIDNDAVSDESVLKTKNRKNIRSMDSVRYLPYSSPLTRPRGRLPHKWKCPLCIKTFKNNDLLQDHIKYPKNFHDPDYKTTKCTTCGETFEKYRLLKTHNINKHGKRPRKPCTICGEIIFDKREHFRKVHPKQYECNFCGKSVRNIVNHSLAVHGSDEDKRFECLICNKRFINRDKLIAHLVIHSDERPYDCKYNCGYKSKTLGNMKKHEMGKHQKIRKFSMNNKQEDNIESLQENFVNINHYFDTLLT